jgi:hypothetical protein
MSNNKSIRENRRFLTEHAKLEPNYDEALEAARQLGFGCSTYRAPSLVCRLLGRHIRPFAMRTCSGDGSWSIDAECCRIGGCHYPWRRADPAKSGLELPSLWEPGSTAFWLDPELWSRTPDVSGRPEICWMHLPQPCGLPLTHQHQLLRLL